MNNSSGLNETNITHASNVTPLPPQADSVGFPLDLKIGLTSAYVVIFLVALFGNSVGFYVVLIKKESSSTSVTNLQLFIGNMAVADLLLTITIMPFSVAYLYRDTLWMGGTLGSITCKALFYVMPVFISASVFTMMLISFDRFYAVFFPLKEKFFQKPKVLSAIIWIFSFGLMTPYVLMFQTKEIQPGVYYCIQEWPWAPPNDTGLTETYKVLKSFHICVFVLVYALPLSITIIIYSLICRKFWLSKIPGNVTDIKLAAEKRLKRKVTRLLVITCVVFAVCWFPVYVNHYFWFVRPDQSHKLPLKVQLLFNWLAHANSALNPCLYILLNEKFRKAFFATLNNFWQFGSSKNNCSDTKSNILRFVTAAARKTNAYALPQSPTRGKSGQANLALSLVSIKDARSPPNNLTEASLNNNTKETKDNALDDAIQV
ncbi:galanin receptor 2a-like [Porites lutea]|uniref:galanin receptor 2a-like n=1 Tax=Porites lutea TaxID=51062 RepID=UPI003CC5A17D